LILVALDFWAAVQWVALAAVDSEALVAVAWVAQVAVEQEA
jgi:hypothetical protein